MRVTRRVSVWNASFPVLFVLATCAGGFAQQVETERTVLAGPFRIHVHCDNEDVAQSAKVVGEETWKIASALYGSKLPKKKMDVYLYRDAEGYIAAEAKLTGGKFKRNLAVALHDSLSAHVALQPTVSDELLATIGMPKQTARLLAHEMGHLVRFQWMSNTFRDHPGWLVDGVASLIDQKVLAATGRMDDPMDDPNFGTYCQSGKQLQKQGRLPSVEELLGEEALDVSFHERYAVRWLFVNMLAEEFSEEFPVFLKDLRRIGGGSSYAERTRKLLLKHLATDLPTLESSFRDYVENLQPRWSEHGRLLETFGPAWHQIAFPDSTATGWRHTPLADSFSLSTTSTIHNVGGKQLNLRIGQRNAFTQFSITAGYGLNIFEFSDKKWETALKKEIDGIEVGKPIELSLTHDEGKTVVVVDGEEVFAGKLGIGSDNLLGIGAQRGSAITWEALKVK